MFKTSYTNYLIQTGFIQTIFFSKFVWGGVIGMSRCVQSRVPHHFYQKTWTFLISDRWNQTLFVATATAARSKFATAPTTFAPRADYRCLITSRILQCVLFSFEYSSTQPLTRNNHSTGFWRCWKHQDVRHEFVRATQEEDLWWKANCWSSCAFSHHTTLWGASSLHPSSFRTLVQHWTWPSTTLHAQRRTNAINYQHMPSLDWMHACCRSSRQRHISNNQHGDWSVIGLQYNWSGFV